MKIENKIILISAILSLSFCSPPSGEAPVAAAIGSGSETAATRKAVETLPPGNDMSVAVPSSSNIPDRISASNTMPVPLINANVPVNAENNIAPPALVPREENPIVQNTPAAAHNNSVPPVLPPPQESPSAPAATPAPQAVEEPQSFIDVVLAPTPAPMVVPVIENPQPQSDIASQISVPDSIIIPPQVVVTPEVALEIIEAVQAVQPSAPQPASEPSVSSSLALLVGGSEPSPVATTPAPVVEPTPAPAPVVAAPEPISTSTSVAEPTPAVITTPTPTPEPVATATPTATSTSVGSISVPTATATATASPVATSTPTATATNTPTATATSTPTATTTATSTPTATTTASPVPVVPPTWQSEITSDIAEKELNTTRCGTYSMSLDTTDGVWYTTRTSGTISGIETYWARQSLWAKFRGICKRGYYRVTVMAKNTEGSLPSSYKTFEVTARNASLPFGHKNKKTAGLIEITADESAYHQASTRVWLEPGDNFVELKWMNDYYVPFFYDANIQIKKVWLEPVVTVETNNLSRTGMQFCALTPNGSEWKWYWKDDYIHTYWANQWADYCFSDLKAVRYKVSITARNYGTLPLASSYTTWRLKVVAGSNETIFTVPANKDFRTGYSFIQVPTGVKTLRVTWLNDSYSAGVYDANIQIKSIDLEEAP